MICKITGKKIKPFMSFGKMPIANGFLSKKNFKKEFFFKMEVGFSKELSLFQLNDHPKPTLMFNKNYPFFTSSSQYMINHFKQYSKWIKKNYFKNDIYNAISENCTVKQILKKITNYKKKISIKFVSSKIMNQLSYHVDKKKLQNEGLFLQNKIEIDIKNTLNLLKNI